MNGPAIAVLSTLFPSGVRPMAGVFIRERMFRVGQRLPLIVVSPRAWFPGQGLVQRFYKAYRPAAAPRELQQGIEVHRPPALCPPGWGRRWDGRMMALAALPLLRRLKHEGRCDILDAHFAYPDGYAASLLGRWLELPYTVTMRGTETRLLRDPAIGHRIVRALDGAARVFTVSDSLRRAGLAAGVPADRFLVVGNGVDTAVFNPRDRAEARAELGLPNDAKVLITVGGLVERKGFHHVIAALPALLRSVPNLHYLIVGEGGPEGDCRQRLERQIDELGLAKRVHFLGAIAPSALRTPLSASDVFVLASSNEGWANVILEAMACGIPVVASDVGGNREVVCRSELGIIYDYNAASALLAALSDSLHRDWNPAALVDYARANSWQSRVEVLVAEFQSIAARGKGIRLMSQAVSD